VFLSIAKTIFANKAWERFKELFARALYLFGNLPYRSTGEAERGDLRSPNS
jgi:hypothetical protein